MDVREKATNEKRLIDASAMRDDWLENGENEYVYDTNAVLDSIDSQPTVDAVEVVRCRECVWSHMSIDPRTLHSAMVCGYKGYNPVQFSQVTDNDFCSHGERE